MAATTRLDEPMMQPELPLLERFNRASEEIEDLQKAVATLEAAMRQVLGRAFRSAAEKTTDDA